MSLRLFTCGVYTFIHWFILVPLLWNLFTCNDWHNLWFLFYEIVAFVIWLIIIILLLNLKCCERKETERLLLRDHVNSSCHNLPQFQTSIAHIQPKGKTKLDNSCLYQSGNSRKGSIVSVSLCSFPVQPQNIPCNSGNKTGIERSENSISVDQNISNVPNSNTKATCLDTPKSMQSKTKENVPEPLSQNRISDDDSVFETCKQDNEGSPSFTKTMLLGNDVGEKHRENVQFLREESFVGLPEMNSFGSYLQLVTVETPFSPGEQFFPDLQRQSETEEVISVSKVKQTNFPENEIPMKGVQEGNVQNDNLPVNADLKEELMKNKVKDGAEINSTGIERQIALCNDDGMRCGEIGTDESTDVFSPEAPVPSAKAYVGSQKGSIGECFIADVFKNENVVSEVFISVGDTNSDTKTCDTICVNIVDEVLKHNLVDDTNSSEEGRWAILK